jgi:lipopolysaccharide exporter
MISPKNEKHRGYFSTGIVRQLRTLPDLVYAGEGLKAKVLRGGLWLGGGSVSEQVVRFGRTIALARILAPEAFGTMAIALSAASVIDTMTDVGAREALIQNPRGEEDRYINAAWWLGLSRGLLVYAVIAASAPWIAKFYGNPELSPLLRVIFLSVLFGSALSPGLFRATKRLEFGRCAVIQNGGGICGVAVTVLLGFLMRNVWALALGYCAESVARCLLSYIVCPSHPRARWDREPLRDLLRFSRGMFGLSFLNLIFSRADVFVLAKLCSPGMLGLYTLTVYLVQTPTSFAMSLLGQTLLPSLARLQQNHERINRALLQVTSLIAVLGMPVLAFMFFCGRSVLTVVYGSRFSQVSDLLFVASCVAFINLLNGQITTVFYAEGRPQMHRLCVGLMAAVMVLSIYPCSRWLGLLGGQIACLLAVGTGYVLQIARLRELTGLNLLRYQKRFNLSALASAVVVAIGFAALPFGTLAKPTTNIAIGVSACLLAYILACSILFRPRSRSVRPFFGVEP